MSRPNATFRIFLSFFLFFHSFLSDTLTRTFEHAALCKANHNTVNLGFFPAFFEKSLRAVYEYNAAEQVEQVLAGKKQ